MMGRAPCCDKETVKKGPWTPEEDAKLLACISKYGIGNWRNMPQKAGLQRCGKSCRLRWTNYLRPDLKHEQFSDLEEQLIIKLHAALGSRWSLIAAQLPGRTDNDVKNFWNTRLKKRLCEMGIDPITHKPISQLLSDLAGSMKLPKVNEIAEATLGCLKDDMLNVIMRKGSEYITSKTKADASMGGNVSNYPTNKPRLSHTKTHDLSSRFPLIMNNFSPIEHQRLLERQQEQYMNSSNSTCNDHIMKRKMNNSTYVNGSPSGPVNGIRSTYATLQNTKFGANNDNVMRNPVVGQLNMMKDSAPPYIMDTPNYTSDMLLQSESNSSTYNNLEETISINHLQMKEVPDLNVINNIHPIDNQNTQHALLCTTLLKQQEESITTYAMEIPFPISMSYPLSPNQWMLEGENPRFHEQSASFHDHTHELLAPFQQESSNSDNKSKYENNRNDQEFFHQPNVFSLPMDGFLWDISKLTPTNIP